MANEKEIADFIARQGIHGDSMLAHINPREAAFLKALGGSGTINPNTGILQFDDGGDGGGDSSGDASSDSSADSTADADTASAAEASAAGVAADAADANGTGGPSDADNNGAANGIAGAFGDFTGFGPAGLSTGMDPDFTGGVNQGGWGANPSDVGLGVVGNESIADAVTGLTAEQVNEMNAIGLARGNAFAEVNGYTDSIMGAIAMAVARQLGLTRTVGINPATGLAESQMQMDMVALGTTMAGIAGLPAGLGMLATGINALAGRPAQLNLSTNSNNAEAGTGPGTGTDVSGGSGDPAQSGKATKPKKDPSQTFQPLDSLDFSSVLDKANTSAKEFTYKNQPAFKKIAQFSDSLAEKRRQQQKQIIDVNAILPSLKDIVRV